MSTVSFQRPANYSLAEPDPHLREVWLRETTPTNEARTSRKWQYTTTFTGEDWAKIGKYAAGNGNASAVKHLSRPILAYVKVPLGIAIIKTPSAKWHVFMYDYLCNKLDVIVNRFQKAGIKQAIEDPAYEVVSQADDEDPFEDLSDCD